MTMKEIHVEIDRASERRADLYRQLSEDFNPALSAELKQLDKELETLWDAHRELRARMRFGDHDKIVKRARLEERLERAA
jgi:ABC-type phosphate transport system auxiliary subunit